MSIDYTPILAVGRTFDNHDEAESFMREHGLLDKTEEEVGDEGGLEECMPHGLEGAGLNYFTGWGFYVGFTISCKDPESFRKDFEDGMEKWDALFKGAVDAEIIHEVQIL